MRIDVFLAQHSSVFDAMFSSTTMEEAKQGWVQIDDTTPDAVSFNNVKANSLIN